ncbi:hypothetical protein FLL45_18270 [Aliikangiella marina]|uniref:Tetratricopeptide repeat protein n=1 Tax=Aliikangiella marina TaxID=1712262 RepID=A0A545T4L4_9GAMM|nr:hypothetical protein [Aliikangiella marina]TQV72166.1 hypothetical protein FLL45_18270 [Aliikangiella marina]
MSKFTFIKLVIAVVLFNPGFIIGLQSTDTFGNLAYAAEKKTPKKTRRTPAMREKIYNQIARAQKFLDEGNKAESVEVIDRLKRRMKQLNSYEKAKVWQFEGFMHFNDNDLMAAVKSFEKVIAEENIPEAFELSTLYGIAQIYMQAQDFGNALLYIDRWADLKGEMTDKSHAFKARILYAQKDWQGSLKSIDNAIAYREAEKKVAKENWLSLKRALHFELKQPKKVTEVSEKLVRLFPQKGKYWVELANMYGETNQVRKQLAVMEAAYQQGFIEKKSDFKALAQLYYFNGAPFKAATILTEQLAAGTLEEDIQTLRFLAQAWSSAKDHAKAIPVLKSASKIAEDGNMDARLVEVYINLEDWDNAIKAGQDAIKKGELKNPGNVHVWMGKARYNLKQYASAIKSFQMAKKEQSVKKTADQWLRFVEKEKRNEERLKLAQSSVGA